MIEKMDSSEVAGEGKEKATTIVKNLRNGLKVCERRGLHFERQKIQSMKMYCY